MRTYYRRMTLFEAGMIAGIPSGGAAGCIFAKAHGALAIAGGAVGGMVAGGAAGLLLAYLVIAAGALFGVLWRATFKRPLTPPAEPELRHLTRLTVPGLRLARPAGAYVGIAIGWWQAAAVMVAIAVSAALLAVIRVQTSRR